MADVAAVGKMFVETPLNMGSIATEFSLQGSPPAAALPRCWHWISDYCGRREFPTE